VSRVFVTGGAGFIGANLVRGLLAAGDEVHLLVRPTSDLGRLAEVAPRVHIHEGSLTDRATVKAAVRRAEPSTVFHLAAASGHPRTVRQRADALRADVLGTFNLVEAMRGQVERLVYLGSCLEYERAPGPVDEDAHVRPSSFRGLAKSASTLVVQQYALAEQRPTTIIRPFHVYGPWEPGTRVIPTLIRSLLEGRPIQTAPAGYGRDFVFIDDLVQACLRAPPAARVPAEVVNVGSGALTTIESLVGILSTLIGAKPTMQTSSYPVAEWDGGAMSADVARAARVLSWRPAHSLAQGLTKTVAWWREQVAAAA
jgi:nucleoside-diphosphate-sugar epimerase